MKSIASLGLVSLMLFSGCAKDKNMEDYRREQLQESLTRITSISGSYSGTLISKIDGTNLGGITLKFQARTDVQANTGNVSNQQNAIVSGSLKFQSLTSAEIVFDNGFYDDQTGDFQVAIQIPQEGGTVSKLSLSGVVSGDRWLGSIEVKGQPEYGGELNLQRNALPPSTSSIEVGGSRLQQINRLNYSYVGTYQVDGGNFPFKMRFIDRDILPEQKFSKLFSPVRNININCDLTGIELNFVHAILDDKEGTLTGSDPFDQKGTPARANLYCVKFEEKNGDFGWDCDIQTKLLIKNMRLSAKRQL